MKKRIMLYSSGVIFLLVTALVATIKAFLGKSVPFTITAFIFFIATFLYAYIVYKTAKSK